MFDFDDVKVKLFYLFYLIYFSKEDKMEKLNRKEEEEEGYICPITRRLMKDPVKAEDGYIYEHKAIDEFIAEFKTSPMTFQELKPIFKPEPELQEKIKKYLELFPDRDGDLNN
jgi:hypothetical protein